MAHIFLEQPNGLYGVFSTVCDDFITLNCTKEEIIEKEPNINESDIPTKSKYYTSFDYVIENYIKDIHGKEVYNKVLYDIEHEGNNFIR